jgi:hypothetical protein
VEGAGKRAMIGFKKPYFTRGVPFLGQKVTKFSRSAVISARRLGGFKEKT